MSVFTRRARRNYAHRASSHREPIFAIAAGILVVAIGIPVAWRALSDDSGHGATARRAASTSSAPQSSAPRGSTPIPSSGSSTPKTTPPVTTPLARTSPGILIRVVPAVRDVQVMVDQTLYTTTSNGIINVPSARGNIDVAYVGYSVIPALQEVSFRSWSDGQTTPGRALDASSRGHVDLAVDVRYRVTVKITGAPAARRRTLTATSPVGPVKFTDGERRWVLAARGEQSSTGVAPQEIIYSFDPPRGATGSQRQTFTPGPEDLWTVQAP